MAHRRHPRAYPPEFRRKVLDLVRAGRGIADLAEEFKIGNQTIRNWLKQEDLDGGHRSDGLTTVERNEFSRLRKEIKQLRIESARYSAFWQSHRATEGMFSDFEGGRERARD